MAAARPAWFLARLFEKSRPALRLRRTGQRRITFDVLQGRAEPPLSVVPDQAKLEASGNGKGRRGDPARQPIPSLRRQSTRYSAHGLHDYRGKFNPQMVRAIGNLMGLGSGAWVLDPFCGSGTTLLEAAHIGWNAIGVDVNPLGEMIANAKVAAFNADPSVISQECDDLVSRLRKPADGLDSRTHLPEPDYLEKWFPVRVLVQLGQILRLDSEDETAIAPERLPGRSQRHLPRGILSGSGRFAGPRRKDPARQLPCRRDFIEACGRR